MSEREIVARALDKDWFVSNDASKSISQLVWFALEDNLYGAVAGYFGALFVTNVVNRVYLMHQPCDAPLKVVTQLTLQLALIAPLGFVVCILWVCKAQEFIRGFIWAIYLGDLTQSLPICNVYAT